MKPSSEIASKLAILRKLMDAHDLGGIRLRGSDWFAWATGGGSNSVLLSTDEGVAELYIDGEAAYVLTNAIEVTRLAEEEIPTGYQMWAGPWTRPELADELVAERARGRQVASDRPRRQEVMLPPDLVAAKLRLTKDEVLRYRQLGQDAAAAMRATLLAATPAWTEFQLAAHGAQELWARGIHPCLTLAAGDRRVARYRHPVPKAETLGRRAMLVFCGRRGGLFANLTRFVYFDAPTQGELALHQAVAQIEAAALDACAVGVRLAQVYEALAAAYAKQGYGDEIQNHHQGGPTGYQAREIIATPTCTSVIEAMTALAWNPSLPGSKIEDTILVNEQGIEVLTQDDEWPSIPCAGRSRPDILVR